MAQFPNVVDSTMINDFRQCPTRFAERYIHCLGVAGEDVNLMFGGCFAKGMEITRKEYFINNKPADEAISLGIQAAVKRWGYFDEPQDHPKNVQNLMMALHGYWEKWPITQPPFPVHDGTAIEQSFAIPLRIPHPDTGADIIYGGKFDMLGSDGTLTYPVDEKTTGSPYFNQSEGWNLWGQFIGYQWACRMMEIDTKQLLVRGIYVLKNDVKYMESIVAATEAVTERWHADLLETIEQMIWMYKRQKYPRVYGTACKVYRVCAYLPLCEATRREDWVNWYKPIEQWNPLDKPGGEL